MPTLWLVCEDRAVSDTLAPHLQGVGELWTGEPERRAFRDAGAPDLVIAVAVDAPGREWVGLERLLEFLRLPAAPGRSAAPVLYVEAPGRRPSATLVASLVDDRPFAALPAPLDPERVAAQVRDLLDVRLPSLRERARRDWVSGRVELLYAGVDLPALRHAIDPRNAGRPVLLCGEPGTQRGVLARYVHNLAEPPRDELVPVAAHALGDDVERLLRARPGRRVTLFLESVDEADPGAQSALASLLAESGALGVETLRWIASVRDPSGLPRALRQLPWLRVDLPPLRARGDLADLARGLLPTLSAPRQVGGADIDDDALEAMRHYLWPGNLRELEAVLDASLTAAGGGRIGRADLRFAPALAPAPDATTARRATHAPEPADTPEIELESEATETPSTPPETTPSAPPETTLPASPETLPVAPEPLAAPPETGEPAAATDELRLADLLVPLGRQIREPLLALRTCATLLEQRPDDRDVRRELASLTEGDLRRAEQTLLCLERFMRLGPPKPEPVDLAALVAGELESRQPAMRSRDLVVLRELELDVPPAFADAEQLRFALGCLLDCALRLTPEGGDLYVGSLHHAEPPSGHRLLIRFHSPEDALVGPEDAPEVSPPLEVVIARTLFSRMGGAFVIDASGGQDNLILIELPAQDG
ncbi:MAG: hypothetical protein JRG76_08850 [Deltaproteobacteria bacterium]|nr:hypothetical protein [Deltaproteobacteria bacterium]